MTLSRFVGILALCLATFTPRSTHAAAGDPDTGWNLLVSGGLARVHATAVQTDGKIIVAGDFTTVLGNTRNNIARLNANGTIDTSFSPNPDGVVYAVAIQNDGDIVFGGRFGLVNSGAISRANLARYNADGTIDTTFTTGTDGFGVNALALDPNGRLIVGGQFTTVGGTARNNIARLNQTNGILDAAFNPNANGDVRAIAIQGNGQVVLGGTFTSLQPNGAASATTRNRIARVNSDGTLDTAFNPNANGDVRAIAIQGNGQVVLGGTFTTLQPNGAASATTRNRLARVSADGSLDSAFTAGADSWVNAIALQADGKILYGGNFTTVTASSGYLARLNADGTADAAFDPAANNEVYTIALQADGRILTGGRFTYWTGATTGGFNVTGSARFANDAGSQSLTINQGIIIWNRSGSLPDLQDIKLEYEYINAGNWQPFSGTTTRVGTSASWQVVSATGLPASSTIRATGRAGNGTSSSTVQYLQSYSGLLTPGIRVSGNNFTITANDSTPSTSDHTDFGSVAMATTDSISRTFTILNNGDAPLSMGTVSAQLAAFNGTYPSGYGYDGAFTVTTQPTSPVAPGGTTTFTIKFDPAGSRQIGTLDYSIYFVHNAPGGGSSFWVRGRGLNSLPYLNTPIPDRSVNVGSTLNYQIPYTTFRDPDDIFDGHSPTYSTSTRPAWLNFNASTRTFSGTPTLAHVGTTDITVTYNDGNGATVSDTFSLNVAAPNSAPTVANPIPDQAATEDSAFSYTFPANTFADVDAGNVFTYSVAGLPSWLTFNPSTRTFSGTPLNEHVGGADIIVTATDNGTPTAASISDTFRVTVANVNDAPLVIGPIPDQNAVQGVAFSYGFSSNVFLDLDAGNVFTYSASGVPAWLSFDPATRTFSGTPGDANVGPVDITVTATDNGTPSTASVTDTFRVTVAGVNDVPVFTKGANQSIPGGTNTLQTVANWATGISDGDSHAVQALTFLIVSNTNSGIFSVAPAIASNGTLTYTPNGSIGTATIGVALRDDTTAGGAALTSATQTFTITVTDTTGPSGGSMNLAPGNMVDAGQTLTVTFSAWSDPSSPLSYAVLVDNVVTSAAGSSASRNITAPSTPGTYTLKGRILDSLGNATEVSQSFTVLTALESWRKLRFGSPENSGVGADAHDFDKDGVVNLVEFAFGMNPKAADNALLPQPQPIGGNLILTYNKPPGVSGITYGAEWSDDLSSGSWQAVVNTGTAEQPVFSLPTASRARMFMRHVISSP